MKKIIIFILFYFSFVKILAQSNQSVDSLINLLKISTEDTDKIKLLNSLYAALKNSMPDRALSYIQQALSLSKKLGLKTEEANACNAIGKIYYDRTNLSLALDFYNKSLQLNKKINSEQGLIQNYDGLGNVYYSLGNNNLSLNYYYQALKIAERKNNKYWISRLNIHIGGVYNSHGDTLNGLKYLKKAFEIAGDACEKKLLPEIYMEIANVYEGTPNSDLALKYYSKALEMYQQFNNIREIAKCYALMGLNYDNRGDYPIALKYHFKALLQYETLDNQINRGEVYMYISYVYLHQKKYKEALFYVDKALQMFRKKGATKMISSAYQALAEIYEAHNNYKMANEYNLAYSDIKDTLYSEKVASQLAEMQTKYETEKKEQKITGLTQETEILQLEASRNRYLMIGLCLVSVLIGIIGFLFIGRIRLKMQQAKMDLEQKLLRAQMNPHFIFNALVNIRSFVYKQKPDAIAKYITDFAMLMRLILENSRQNDVIIEKEIATLGYYLELQKLRFGDKLDYSIEVDPSVNVDFVSIPPMLAQPFIENSIEHGIRNKDSGKGIILVKFIQEENALKMVIEDNGVGRKKANELKKETAQQHNSLAIKITEERLNILNRKKGKKITFSILDLKDDNGLAIGTNVTFRFQDN
ncbi:MAG TPA: histidine kinase [Bacteroidia bacterium]|jgi:tetratricopeptide (TPR) repeat protein|nr:histidine kinase [Bacteroidia bacterium]